MRIGMLRDATLQALLRGHARMGVAGDCGECEAVLVQVKQTGLSDADLLGMFAEAGIVEDHTLMPMKPLTGNLSKLDDIVVRRLKAGETVLTNPSLYEELHMSKSNFGSLVAKPAWKSRVAQLGLRPQKLPGRMSGLRLVA